MFDKYMLIYNGKFYPSNNFLVKFNNRAMLYGDSIFETIFASGSNIHFFSNHIERLIEGMNTLEYKIPEKLEIYPNKFLKEIKRLLIKNKLFAGAKIRITFFREQGGLYTPENNNVNYIITAEKTKNSKYELNEKGFTIGVFDKIEKPINIFSKYKTANNLIYILAGKFSKENNFDECLILNTDKRIAETVSSNFFYKKNNKIYTPALSEGCISGVLRKNVIKQAKLAGFKVIETRIEITDLLNADEVFLTNSITGVRWVLAFENKRYYNNFSKRIIDELNKKLY